MATCSIGRRDQTSPAPTTTSTPVHTSRSAFSCSQKIVMDVPRNDTEPEFPVYMSAAQKKRFKQQQNKEKDREDRERRYRIENARQAIRLDIPTVDLGDSDTSVPIPPVSCIDSPPQSPAPSPGIQPTPDLVTPPASREPSSCPTPPPPPPSFNDVRAKLMCQMHFQMLNGGSFTDATIHLFSKRNRTGSPHAPRALALNRRILQAASPAFENCVYRSYSLDSLN